RLCIELHVTAGQCPRRRTWDTQIGRVEDLSVGLALVHHPDGGRGRGRQLVQAVVAAKDQGRGATAGEHTGDDLTHAFVEHPDGRGGRLRRGGQRPQEVEDGRYRQLTAGFGGETERGVEDRSETEGDPRFLGHLDGQFRRQVQDHTQAFQHVRGATGGGCGTVAVLDHACT